MQKLAFASLALVAWFGTIAGPALAATQEEVDEAKRVQELWAARQAAAESRKATAEADAAAAKAKLGVLDLSKFTKPEIEAKTLNLEGKILSYQALDRVAGVISEGVVPHVASAANGVVVIDDKTFNAIQQSRSFKRGATTLVKTVSGLRVPPLAADNANCEEPRDAGAGVGLLGGIDVALQIAQIFKVDRSLEGTDVTIDDFALSAAVMSKLKAAEVKKVVLASAYLPGGLQPNTPDTELLKQLDSLTDAQVTVDLRVAELTRRRNRLQAREADTAVKPPEACKAAFEEARQTYDSFEARAKALKDRIDRFLTAATATDEKTGAPALQSMAQAESLAKTFAGAHVLHLKPIAGGGTTYTKKNLLWSSVGVGGGAIVSYVLTAGDAGVVASATVAEYGGFVGPEELGGFIESKRPTVKVKQP